MTKRVYPKLKARRKLDKAVTEEMRGYRLHDRAVVVRRPHTLYGKTVLITGFYTDEKGQSGVYVQYERRLWSFGFRSIRPSRN